MPAVGTGVRAASKAGEHQDITLALHTAEHRDIQVGVVLGRYSDSGGSAQFSGSSHVWAFLPVGGLCSAGQGSVVVLGHVESPGCRRGRSGAVDGHRQAVAAAAAVDTTGVVGAQ